MCPPDKDATTKQAEELFAAAFKLGAIFGHNSASLHMSKKAMIDWLEKNHPTPENIKTNYWKHKHFLLLSLNNELNWGR